MQRQHGPRASTATSTSTGSLPMRPSSANNNVGHSLRRLSANTSELGVLEQHQHPRSTSSTSTASSTVSSSPSSSGNNMMKKLGSRFALKSRSSNKTPAERNKLALGASTGADSIEELADEDEDEDELQTARPRNGRVLTAHNSMRPGSIHGNGNDSALLARSNSSTTSNGKMLRHRSSLSNLNTSTASNASVASSSTGMRQPGTLRHRASISSISSITSVSELGTTSPLTGASSRVPSASLRHRSSISSLSSLTSPSGSGRPAGFGSTNSTSSGIPASTTRLRTLSSASVTQKLSLLPSTTTGPSDKSSGNLASSRRLSATHTGLASVRTRTTSLVSPPSSGLPRAPTSGKNVASPSIASAAVGDTSQIGSMARRGIPKSSTSGTLGLPRQHAPTASSASSAVAQHKRIGSLVPASAAQATGSPSQAAATPKAATANGARRLQHRNVPSGIGNHVNDGLEDSPGLTELLHNTTLQMADLQDMLSPLAPARVGNSGNHNHLGLPGRVMSANGKKASSKDWSSHKVDVEKENHENEDEDDWIALSYGEEADENYPPQVTAKQAKPALVKAREQQQQQQQKTSPQKANGSPTKSALPMLKRAQSTSSRSPASSTSPAPSNNVPRPRTASPKKSSSALATNITANAEIRKVSPSSGNVPTLSKDGLPLLARGGAAQLALPAPSRVQRSHSPLSRSIIDEDTDDNGNVKSSAVGTPLRGAVKESDDDIDRLLMLGSHGGFLSPSRDLVGNSSTHLMQSDLSSVLMTPMRALPTATAQKEKCENARGTQVDIEVLLQAEREKMRLEYDHKARVAAEESSKLVAAEHSALLAQLAERDAASLKHKSELEALQRLLSSAACSAVKNSEMEALLSRRETSDSTIRRLKRDLEDCRVQMDKQSLGNAHHETAMAWKGYVKDLEIESEQVESALQSLESLKMLVAHVAACARMAYGRDVSGGTGEAEVVA